MIAKMKKVWIVLREREKRSDLKSLGDLGLVHLEKISGSGMKLDELTKAKGNLQVASSLAATAKKAKVQKTLSQEETLDRARDAVENSLKAKAIRSEIGALKKEIDRIASWGSFDPEQARSLAESGVPLSFYEIDEKKITTIDAETSWLLLSREKGKAKVAVIQGGNLPQGTRAFSLPETSLKALEEKVREKEKEASIADAEIERTADCVKAYSIALSRVESEIRFETIHSGINTEGELCYLFGWVPEDAVPGFTACAVREGWGIAVDDLVDTDQPPTKVENNGFVRIIKPVFDFLGMVPAYREYEISGWFLAFFSLFFAMIFGDGGYGSLMFAVAAAGIVKSAIKGKRINDGLKLFALVSFCTVVWGSLTGIWFGMDVSGSKIFLSSFVIPQFTGPSSQNNIKFFCFILGAFQLSLAHVKNIIRDFPNPKFLAQVGWLAMVLGLYFFVLNLVISSADYPIPDFSLYLLGAGFVLVFVFGSWTGKIGSSLLAGLGNLLSQFLGTVGAFGDIISYIRLFAVGLAGFYIADTVNKMAANIMTSPWLIPLGVVVILFGHILNIAMSFLSVIVHGIRLNLLEFSGHLGMEWSGYEYVPFSDSLAQVAEKEKE